MDTIRKYIEEQLLTPLFGNTLDADTSQLITWVILGVIAVLALIIIIFLIRIIADSVKINKKTAAAKAAKKQNKKDKRQEKKQQKQDKRKEKRQNAEPAARGGKKQKRKKPDPEEETPPAPEPVPVPQSVEDSAESDIQETDFALPELEADDVEYQNASDEFSSLASDESDPETTLSDEESEEIERRRQVAAEFAVRRQNSDAPTESTDMDISYEQDLLEPVEEQSTQEQPTPEQPAEEEPEDTTVVAEDDTATDDTINEDTTTEEVPTDDVPNGDVGEEDVPDDSLTARLNRRQKIRVTEDMMVLPREFVSFLRQTSEENKLIYNELKNTLLSYKGVKATIFKNYEAFRCNGLQARIMIKGKTVYLYLRILPESIDPEWVNIKVKDVSSKKAFVETPTEVRVTGKKKINASKKLIDEMFAAQDIKKDEGYIFEDFTVQYPYIPNAVINNGNLDLSAEDETDTESDT